ncbi:MAG TPA: M48 family metallopeptidase [Planctomycetota bacterium]|nr:M48 family metallopeptidase [Planctomycetota bacterium]HQB00736.1 M48 family metallopeptidase [Planctomycetota bacterium]
MNNYFFLILFLFFYFLKFFIDLFLSSLNQRYIQKHTTVPELYKDFVSEETFQKSKAYHAMYYRFHIASSCFFVALFLVCVYSGLLNYVDILLRSWIASNILRGLALFGIILLFMEICSLPFSYYAHFVVEEKFGFNRQTVRLWIKDKIIGLILSCVLLCPVLSLAIYFIENIGSYWWIYVWLLFFSYGLLISFIYPIFIAPIFNKFTPLEEGSLRTRLESLVKKANFPLKNVFVMDASKRSVHSNAYFAGLGKTKRLVLYDSMLKDFSEEELETVVAHEIGHYKKHHILKSLLLSQFSSFIFFFLAGLILHDQRLYDIFFVQNQSTYMGLLSLSIISGIISSYLSPLTNFFSWKYETEADVYALELTGNKEPFKTMLFKLEEKNLSNLTPHPVYARYYYSHPPTAIRIQRAFNIANIN